MNKSNFKQIFLTLALLITAATGAWAAEETVTWEGSTLESIDVSPATKTQTIGDITITANSGYFMTITEWPNPKETDAAAYEANGLVFSSEKNIKSVEVHASDDSTFGGNCLAGVTSHTYTLNPAATSFALPLGDAWLKITKIVFTLEEAAPAAETLDVTLTDNTVATMEMPASDVTVEYSLVRDLTQQVTFGGIPTGDGLVVKNNGTAYEFVTTPDITLIDALNGNANITEGITITVGKMVEVEGIEGHRLFDEATAVSLADFLANPQPGTYKMKATANADGPYDGTITSAEFTTVEKYDLLIQPADEYSKDKLSEVTVAGTAQTLDPDGKATVTNVAPGAEVKLKANRGYVIEKVEAKKPGPVAAPLDNTTTAWSAGTYAVPAGGLTYSDAITVTGDVTLVLTDGETLTLNRGISIASGATLTVQGNGTMNVNGTNNSTASTVAGTGTLVLTSGTLTATGGNGASIGGYDDNKTGNDGGMAINGSVTVAGGTLNATGGNGGNIGEYATDSKGGAGSAAISGSVTVAGGTLTARGGNGGNLVAYGNNNKGGAGGAAISGDLTMSSGSTAAIGGNGGDSGEYTASNCIGGAGGAAIAGNATRTGGTLTQTDGIAGSLAEFSSGTVGTGGKAVAGTVTGN